MTASTDPWQIVFAKGALRQMRRLPKTTRDRVEAGLRTVAEDPTRPHSNMVRLKADPGFRLRVGRWRALFELEYESRTVRVLGIAARGSAYRK